MTDATLVHAAPPGSSAPSSDRASLDWRRLAPTLVAGGLALVYLIASPPSLDLAAHLLRAKLFAAEGFGLWNLWWYGGHHVLGYSVLFPPVAAAIGPRLAACIAATASAWVFELLARRQFGDRAWLGSVWFGAATATSLFTGRLAFAFGLLPALATALALQRRRPALGCGAAFMTAMASPVAALFAALAGVAWGAGRLGGVRAIRGALVGLGVAGAALVPVLVLAVAFPEGGSQPFALATLWPILAIALAALIAVPRQQLTLRAGILLYAVGCIAAYALSTPVGSNAARLGPLVAGPLAALVLWPRRKALLLAVALPLLYLQWQAPVRDLTTSAGDPSTSAAYYQPLLAFLESRPGPPFRVEVPATRFHFESYEVAPRFPLARGWERQLDVRYDRLFYDGALTPAGYYAWLHALAVGYVALPDAPLDYSSGREAALIERGLPYLRPVLRTRHWRVYAVVAATPIVQGPAILRALGPDSVTLSATHAGTILVRVRFTPYWALRGVSGCVAPAAQFTRLRVVRSGPARLVIDFSPGRIGAHSPRCTTT
jgi:hypothetical protein